MLATYHLTNTDVKHDRLIDKIIDDREIGRWIDRYKDRQTVDLEN